MSQQVMLRSIRNPEAISYHVFPHNGEHGEDLQGQKQVQTDQPHDGTQDVQAASHETQQKTRPRG